MNKRLNIVSIAVKNLSRKIVRTVLLLLAVTVVTGTIFFATLFISSMQNALKIGTYRLGADILSRPCKKCRRSPFGLALGRTDQFLHGQFRARESEAY